MARSPRPMGRLSVILSGTWHTFWEMKEEKECSPVLWAWRVQRLSSQHPNASCGLGHGGTLRSHRELECKTKHRLKTQHRPCARPGPGGGATP